MPQILVALLPILESRKEIEWDRVERALDALSEAYYSTVSYYESNKAAESDRRHEQLQLSRKWDRVANRLRLFDSNLSNRFGIKSRFWQEGEAWDAA